MKLPNLPFDLKKIPQPAKVFSVWVIAGFCLAGILFAVLSGKPASRSTPSVKENALQTSEPVSIPASKPALTSEPLARVDTAAPVVDAELYLEEKTATPFLTLSGVLYGEKGSVALINGKVVPEGGMVKGAKVEKITSERVELSYEGKKIILHQR